MNTANLQLEGPYLSVAALTNLLVSKGVLSREEIDGALQSAERTAVTDYRADELRPAHRDAVAFPARFLQLANNSAGDGATAGFAELAKLVGKLKDDEPLPQRAVGDEDPNFSPMDGFRGDPAEPVPRERRPDMSGAEGIASARADEDTYD